MLQNKFRGYRMVEYKHTGGAFMNTREVIYELRRKKGLSQDELAEKVYVTRQAVSRWETGVSHS